MQPLYSQMYQATVKAIALKMSNAVLMVHTSYLINWFYGNTIQFHFTHFSTQIQVQVVTVTDGSQILLMETGACCEVTNAADGLRFGHWCSKDVANVTPYTNPLTHCSFTLEQWLSGRTCQQTNLFCLTFCHLSHQLKQHIKRPFSIKLQSRHFSIKVQSLLAVLMLRKGGRRGKGGDEKSECDPSTSGGARVAKHTNKCLFKRLILSQPNFKTPHWSTSWNQYLMSSKQVHWKGGDVRSEMGC